jgi:hypothetical protein
LSRTPCAKASSPARSVYPDLQDVDFLCRDLLHRFPRFHDSGYPVGCFRASRFRHGDPTTGSPEPRCARYDFVPYLEGHIRGVLAEARDDRDAVISLSLQLIDERCPFVGHVVMGVDDRRHDGFAAQIHAPRSGWRGASLSGGANLSETSAIHDEGRIFDWRTAIAGNQSRSFENGDRPASTLRRRRFRQVGDQE